MSDRRRSAAVLVLTALVVVVGNATAIAINAVTDISDPWPLGLEVIRQNPFRSSAVLTVAALLVAVALTWYQRDQQRKPVPLAGITRPDWVIDRPAEVEKVVNAIRRRRSAAVAITTALNGAGGFGKTTIARIIGTDRRVQRTFRGGVIFVTLGRDLQDPASIADKVNDVIKTIGGEATYTDPELAGRRLASLLDEGPRRLLIIDDVWTAEQLEPFVLGGKRCARLVTTRLPKVLGGRALQVHVDQMSTEQARTLLTRDLPDMPDAIVAGLLQATGRWPLLLHLVNRVLVDGVTAGADITRVASDLLTRLRQTGPVAVDRITGAAYREINVDVPSERAKAVRATIEASTGLLAPHEIERFRELCVFSEDESIPFTLVAALWRTTGGLAELDARHLCSRLADLALVQMQSGNTGGGASLEPTVLSLHDVIRDYCIEELGPDRIAALHRTLVDVASQDLPYVDGRRRASPTKGGTLKAFWEMAPSERYLYDHVVEHLVGGDRRPVAEALACDLRWIGKRLARSGVVAPYRDLSTVATPRSAAIRATLARIAHLLGPTDPPHSLLDILYSRVDDDPELGRQVPPIHTDDSLVHIRNRWPLPDLADSSVRLVLSSQSEVVTFATAQNLPWLASAHEDGRIRIWDTETGQNTATIHAGTARAVAVSPDGRFLAASGSFGTTVWETSAWSEVASFSTHAHWYERIDFTATGEWLIVLDVLGGIVALNPTSRAVRELWRGGVPSHSLLVSPLGSWIAFAAKSAFAVIDVESASVLYSAKGSGEFNILAAAPNGKWLAVASPAALILLATDTWTTVTTIPGHYRRAVYSGNSEWLAMADSGGRVKILDTERWRAIADLSVDHAVTELAAAPDGSWLAGVNGAGVLHVWNIPSGIVRASVRGSARLGRSTAITAESSWLIAIGPDSRSIRIWDATKLTPFTDHDHTEIHRIAADARGEWIAGSHPRGVTVWSARRRRATELDARNVVSVSFSPDGDTLAVGAISGVVTLFETKTWRHRRRENTSLTALTLAHNDRLIGVSTSRQIVVIDLATWSTRSFAADLSSPVDSVATSPDGRLLGVAESNGPVMVFDLESERLVASLSAKSGRRGVLVFSPDGRLMVHVRGGDVHVIDTAGWNARLLTGPTAGQATAAAFSPDGRWLAVTSSDGGVRVLDGEVLNTVAFMRVDFGANCCTWVSIPETTPDRRSTPRQSLAVGGPAGVYLFDVVSSAE